MRCCLLFTHPNHLFLDVKLCSDLLASVNIRILTFTKYFFKSFKLQTTQNWMKFSHNRLDKKNLPTILVDGVELDNWNILGICASSYLILWETSSVASGPADASFLVHVLYCRGRRQLRLYWIQPIWVRWRTGTWIRGITAATIRVWLSVC